MTIDRKNKRRGFVMTGGGAKGLYEAGVIHAFHVTGMEFDVITGSSIGAFNSVFFAEYLLGKHQLPPDVLNDPERAIEAMDDMVKAYHHAWLQFPDKKVIDDSEQGPLGKLKNDLLHFNISLPDITQIIWWWTDPKPKSIPAPGVWPALFKLGRELIERLGGAGELLNIIKHHRRTPIQSAVRTYLARFGIERSLVKPEEDSNLKSLFTEAVSPLRLEHLLGMGKEPGDGKVVLIHPARTLRDYYEAGIEVHLTRANFRTGRLEISAYLSTEDFIHYLEKQAFRLRKTDPEKVPLGSFRIQLPGNPNTINAALASGRFPGVFAPYKIEDLYPIDDAENSLLYRLLANWLDDPVVEASLSEAYLQLHTGKSAKQEKWNAVFNKWRQSDSMRAFFPKTKDTYVDGGAIDNTPSNSAIDATREWAETSGISKRDIILELYVVFLDTEPMVAEVEAQHLELHKVIQRTLEIQSAAKRSSDIVVVNTINAFGKRAEHLGDTLLVMLESYQEALSLIDEDKRSALLDNLLEKVRELNLKSLRGKTGEETLEKLDKWAYTTIENRLPLQVNTVNIYPQEMPLSTLQFTERLGYRQENAINMLTMGCHNTLWALLDQLGREKNILDPLDQRVLKLTKKWIGIDALPEGGAEREKMSQTWRCQRTKCVFNQHHCLHGAGLKLPVI